MVITSSVKCLEHSVCRVTGESISVAHTVHVYVCTFALGCVARQARVRVLQHGTKSQFQGGNRSRRCQTGAQWALWCLNGGSVPPVSLVTRSVGTERGLPVSAGAGCCNTAVQDWMKPHNPQFHHLFQMVFISVEDFAWSFVAGSKICPPVEPWIRLQN